MTLALLLLGLAAAFFASVTASGLAMQIAADREAPARHRATSAAIALAGVGGAAACLFAMFGAVR